MAYIRLSKFQVLVTVAPEYDITVSTYLNDSFSMFALNMQTVGPLRN
jgi:hypothetical protein